MHGFCLEKWYFTLNMTYIMEIKNIYVIAEYRASTAGILYMFCYGAIQKGK